VSALLRRLRRDESGMSITELVVTMMVTSILLAIVASMFINVAKVTANSNASNSRSSVAANVMEGITKVIRTAANNDVAGSEDPDPALVVGLPNSLTILSYVDTSALTPSPTKVVYRVDANGNVLEDRYASSLSAGYWVFASTASTRTLGGPVQTLTGTDSLFVYLDATNKVVTPASGGLTLLERDTIASIRVNVRILNALSTGADPIVVTNTIGMPNLKISRTDD